MRCLNWKAIGGLAALVAAVALFAPGAGGAVAPFALVLACPLSMVLMMGAMSGGSRDRRAEGAPSAADPREVDQLRAEVAELRARQRS